MLERLVENWLDNAGERSYQRCFCQMLTGQGYRIVHNTEHTPLEFGKDVIAIAPDGKLVGYQLKGNPGGTLKPAAYDTIRVQLEQLATLALTIPGLGKKVPDECYLVTNGEIDEAVYQQIQLLNTSLLERGHPAEKIKTITRGTMLAWANSLGLALWPSEVDDFANLIRVLNYEGTEIFPVAIFDPLLQHTLSFHKKVKKDELRRRVTSAAIMTAVALNPFSRKRNHYAELTAWMMFITYVMAACGKNQISYSKNCKEAVLVARDAIFDLLGLLCDEIAQRQILSSGEIFLGEGNPFSEFAFYQPRALLLYMLMSIYWIWSEQEGWKKESHKAVVEKLIPANPPANALWGEGAIPHFITYLWYRKRLDATLKQDVILGALLTQLLQNKLGTNEPLASPRPDTQLSPAGI